MAKLLNNSFELQKYYRQLQAANSKISKMELERQAIEAERANNTPKHSAEIVFDFILFGKFSRKRRAAEEVLAIRSETVRIEIEKLTSEHHNLLKQIEAEKEKETELNERILRIQKEEENARVLLEEKHKAEAEKLKKEAEERKKEEAALKFVEELTSLLSENIWTTRRYVKKVNKREIQQTFKNIEVVDSSATIVRNDAKLHVPGRRTHVSEQVITKSNNSFRSLNDAGIDSLDFPNLKKWKTLVDQHFNECGQLSAIKKEISDLVQANELASNTLSDWDGELCNFIDTYKQKIVPISSKKTNFTRLTHSLEILVRYEEDCQKCTQTIQELQLKIDDKIRTQFEYLRMVRDLTLQDPCSYSKHFLAIIDFIKPYFDECSSIRSIRSSGDILLGEFEITTAYTTFVGSKAKRASSIPPQIQSTILRYLYLLFKSDKKNNFSVYAVNLYGNWIDKRTGITQNGIIGSISASPESLSELNFKLLDVDECFQYLKGIKTTNPSYPTPIRPIIKFDLNDDRLIATKDIKSLLDQGQNLANMPWEDFEHLVAQILAEEFSGIDVDIKTTKASRDKGVDAVIFDPNLITGGKIVVQAKRYNNTVNAAAVRELYGTILNEGANRGILITTSSFGQSSYEFAKDKPITLIDGSLLMQLIRKQGLGYKIELK